jgi:Protein tyrosine and serine/threonine kinase/Ankyrin repeats (3 copies)
VILHQDLKTRNILLDRAVTHCVICDFGVSRLQDKSQTAGHRSSRGGMVGSVNTMAPEVMEGREYTRASDVYSFAMVAHEMFTGDVSFKGMRAIQVMFMVTEGERPQIDETVVPPALTKLLERCWAADPASRPDFDSIMTVLTSDALIDECDALEKRLHDAGERATSSITYMSRSLLDLAHAGDVDGVKRLILRDADVNYADYDRRTALHIACAEGQSRVVDLLLESGSDFNLKDRWGGTPLTDARRNGHDGVVARLLVAGAALDLDVKVSNRVTSDDLLSSSILEGSAYGGGSELAGARIPQMRRHLELMLAVFAGNVDGCRALLARGYSVNASDYDGRTPCHLAVSEGNFEIVSLLLEFGCDTNLPDRWGSTALDEALRLGRTEILTLFEDAQATHK